MKSKAPGRALRLATAFQHGCSTCEQPRGQASFFDPSAPCTHAFLPKGWPWHRHTVGAFGARVQQVPLSCCVHAGDAGTQQEAHLHTPQT